MADKIDFETIREKTGIDDRELIITVAAALAREASVRLNEIEQGLEAKNAHGISIAAHTLKGAAKAMVMTRLAKSAEAIEAAARQEDLAAVSAEIPNLADRVRETLLAVDAFVEQAKP